MFMMNNDKGINMRGGEALGVYAMAFFSCVQRSTSVFLFLEAGISEHVKFWVHQDDTTHNA